MFWCFHRFWHPFYCWRPLLFQLSLLLFCCFRGPCYGLPSQLILNFFLFLVFQTFLPFPAVFASRLVLPPCCCLRPCYSWLPCCCWCTCSCLVILLLLSPCSCWHLRLPDSDYRTTTIGQVIFSAIGLSIIGLITKDTLIKKKRKFFSYSRKSRGIGFKVIYD